MEHRELSFNSQQKPDENHHRLYRLLSLRSVAIFDCLLDDTNQRITFAWRTLESTQRYILFARRVNVRKAIRYHVPSLEKIKVYLRADNGLKYLKAAFVWSPSFWRGISMALRLWKGILNVQFTERHSLLRFTVKWIISQFIAKLEEREKSVREREWNGNKYRSLETAIYGNLCELHCSFNIQEKFDGKQSTSSDLSQLLLNSPGESNIFVNVQINDLT